jgi:hypothetical protein
MSLEFPFLRPIPTFANEFEKSAPFILVQRAADGTALLTYSRPEYQAPMRLSVLDALPVDSRKPEPLSGGVGV